ncbi:GT4 family glycosyltransferase PelF [Fusibacter ferrireducens]|uniref:GT4 family glycosyltransferase PelF n=1 Tax=Fusibacter ferrireducens TaxID=2785058 RepID=A0ABR9ZW43_9FIRM|nr:GT4 family glycosyltransferase PelF [Fusibacter ferrireducens]MBF4694201.1 GT4 family glycosyltransferase PelF [Fusibacter ferrireducens]
MKICIIAEGSYPYITGGVSSWVNTLIQNMDMYEFVIYAIAPEEKSRGDFKYDLPKNVSGVSEVFLDSWKNEPVVKQSKLKFSILERETIKELILGRPFDWDHLFKLIEQKKVNAVQDFLLSRDFFDIVYQAYVESYSQTPFTEFFWTMRSLLLPLFHIMKHDIPEADVYHAPSTGYAGIVGSLAKRRYGKPLIITEHGIYTREREIEIIKATWMKNYYKNMWIEFFYNLSRCSYDYADRVITLFNRNKEVEITLGCNENIISIIPNGVDYDGFSKLAKVEPIRKPNLKYSVGAIVRVVPIKDIKTMISAFALVKQELPETEFVIIGPIDEDEDYYNECIQLVEDLKLKDLTFTGKADVKSYIPHSDLFVLSSISEGQPLSLLETMACGKPNIATDVGSCKEVIYGSADRLGKCGVVVPIMDYVTLSKSIVKLLRDEPLRKEMGEIAMKRVDNYFRREMMVNSYMDIYEEMGNR